MRYLAPLTTLCFVDYFLSLQFADLSTGQNAEKAPGERVQHDIIKLN